MILQKRTWNTQPVGRSSAGQHPPRVRLTVPRGPRCTHRLTRWLRGGPGEAQACGDSTRELTHQERVDQNSAQRVSEVIEWDVLISCLGRGLGPPQGMLERHAGMLRPSAAFGGRGAWEDQASGGLLPTGVVFLFFFHMILGPKSTSTTFLLVCVFVFKEYYFEGDQTICLSRRFGSQSSPVNKKLGEILKM